jgi:transcription termination/antitermination protein NusG
MISEVRQWSDRKQTLSLPLFGGYIFVRIDPLSSRKLAVLKTPGVVRFIGNTHGPVAIPGQQIEDIRTVLALGIHCEAHPFLKEGDRVRVVRGALVGVEGTLLRTNSESRLLVSIEMIQRSVAVNVSRQDVEPVYPNVA